MNPNTIILALLFVLAVFVVAGVRYEITMRKLRRDTIDRHVKYYVNKEGL